MIKIYFARLEAAHAFASMAEAMAENETDPDEWFEADQYTLLANMVWGELQRDDDNPHYPYFVTMPNTAGDFATAVRGSGWDRRSAQMELARVARVTTLGELTVSDVINLPFVGFRILRIIPERLSRYPTLHLKTV